jgi:tRNA-2-methylthio-N6-dimethylallyladenosine synthase
MIRRYTREEYLERVEALTLAVPELTISTDIIVGFPGETSEQFRDTLALVDELPFVGLFGFKYSPRPFTPAMRLTDDVAESEKSARLEMLFSRHEPRRRGHLQSLVGTVQEVLVEGTKSDGAYTGRTERNEIVHFASKADVTGKIVPVTIAIAFKNSLAAELLDESIRIDASELPRLAGESGGKRPVAPSEPIRIRDERQGASTRRQLPVI